MWVWQKYQNIQYNPFHLHFSYFEFLLLPNKKWDMTEPKTDGLKECIHTDSACSLYSRYTCKYVRTTKEECVSPHPSIRSVRTRLSGSVSPPLPSVTRAIRERNPGSKAGRISGAVNKEIREEKEGRRKSAPKYPTFDFPQKRYFSWIAPGRSALEEKKVLRRNLNQYSLL